jgi:alpha-glucosidase
MIFFILQEMNSTEQQSLTPKYWWQDAIIYQIYPRSFQDSDDDGIGDLEGIRRRLDYLQWLGVNAIWICPIYPSPMADFGYDVSDYCAIHPLFGTMEEFDQLLSEVHRRGMKLILDLVPNHTSDQHPWFFESRVSRDNPRRDWYLWQNPAPDGGPPNNWLAMFGGSAWEWDEGTGQYYYHAFLKEQPDLNWRNPAVRVAIYEVMRFWLGKGVDGFRIDVLWHLIKDEQLRDNPVNIEYTSDRATYEQLLPLYSTDQPEVQEIIHEMRAIADEYGDRVLIGEVYLPVHRLVAYYGVDNKGAHLPFNFQLITLPWDAMTIAVAIDQYEAALPAGGWPNWVLGNHDQHRVASRVGLEQARVVAMLLLTLRGTPTIYYGDETGMADVPIPSEEMRDPQGRNMPGRDLGRDPARTPMQWDGSANAGFSSGSPWLRLPRTASRWHVQAQRTDPYSILSLYRRLIKLRREEPSLRWGSYIPVYASPQLIVFTRHAEDCPRLLVVLNLSHRPCRYNPDPPFRGTIIASTWPDAEGQRLEAEICLYGDEGIVVRLD